MKIESVEVLILSPHADDEVLGCFSFLSPNSYVVYFGIEDRVDVSRCQRIEEVQRSATRSGFRWESLEHRVNRYDARDLIRPIEDIIGRLRPDTVLLPQPSYNQDHRAVYDAAVVALRPHDRNWFVRNVLVFEQPDSILWPHGGEREPNLFRPISIADKLHSYELYASQVRAHRSPELVTALAKLRGAQSGQDYAEGFTVRRLLSVG
jgi:LmbE family N-acetylglucosaminyl deacetylase